MQVLVILEKSNDGFSCYSPDVGGCISVGETFEQTINNMQEALELHFEGLIESRITLPSPHKAKEVISDVHLENGDILTTIEVNLAPQVSAA